jgi:hypothetical protein
LEHSIDRARRRRDRKFKPLVLGQIQAAGDMPHPGEVPGPFVHDFFTTALCHFYADPDAIHISPALWPARRAFGRQGSNTDPRSV